MRSGLVEVVKMAALLDLGLLERVEQRLDLLLTADPAELVPVVAAAAAAKIAVVERDPTEQGDRRLLNFGHTLGHAIESACGYSGIRHGEAVGYGILFALRLAVSQGLDPFFAQRLARLLRRFDLPRLPRLECQRADRPHGERQEGAGVGSGLGAPRGSGRGEDGERDSSG